MATPTGPKATPAAAPTKEPKDNAVNDAETTTVDAKDNAPTPATITRESTFASNMDNEWYNDHDDDYIPRSRPPRRNVNYINNNRRYSISPVRVNRRHRSPVSSVSTYITSSAGLLTLPTDYDGIIDLPFPARSSIYVTTYPQTQKDVLKWTWLFARGIEDVFVPEPRGDGSDVDDRYVPHDRHYRSHSPHFEPLPFNTVDVPFVFLSRALDTAVVDADKLGPGGVKYLIVVGNRVTPKSAKLLVAESRKAAGIRIFYEALVGNSVLFVGAVKGAEEFGKKRKRVRFVRVEGLGEAEGLQEGEVGVVC